MLRFALGTATAAIMALLPTSAQPCCKENRGAADCRIIVYNRTPDALEIRMNRDEHSLGLTVGELNPGESLTHKLPCTRGRVFVAGFGMPLQTGAPPRVRAIGAWADLIRGDPVAVSLVWP